MKEVLIIVKATYRNVISIISFKIKIDKTKKEYK